MNMGQEKMNIAISREDEYRAIKEWYRMNIKDEMGQSKINMLLEKMNTDWFIYT